MGGSDRLQGHGAAGTTGRVGDGYEMGGRSEGGRKICAAKWKSRAMTERAKRWQVPWWERAQVRRVSSKGMRWTRLVGKTRQEKDRLCPSSA